MSPASSRAQMRQRRNLLVSVLAVVVISLGLVCSRVRGQMDPAPRPRPGGWALRRLPDRRRPCPTSELQETVAILNNRVNGLGVSGAQVSTAGNNEISVSIPGVKDAATRAGRDREHGPALLPAGAVHRLPPDVDPGHQGHQDDARPNRPRRPSRATSTLPACGASYATNAGQPGRHAQQLGAGVLVQQPAARPRRSPSTRAPAPT